jgi:hypothetical protein
VRPYGIDAYAGNMRRRLNPFCLPIMIVLGLRVSPFRFVAADYLSSSSFALSTSNCLQKYDADILLPVRKPAQNRVFSGIPHPFLFFFAEKGRFQCMLSV